MMCEELQKEIEEFSSSGRRERRKKERELRIKYNNNDITIKGGKKFKKSSSINRAQRREITKNNDFLKELRKIISKYLPGLYNLISNLTDKRNKSYIKYNMKTIIVTKIFSLLCGITTMKGINETFNTEESINNLSIICNSQLKEIPDWQTIQDVIEELDYNEIDNIRKWIFKTLLRSKMFDKYRHNGAIQIIVDATGLTSLDYNLNGNCLSRTRDGKTKYYKYVLEAKAVFGNMVISVDSEWVENGKLNNENNKQDCEIEAFKRLEERLKKSFPKLELIITGDALYANTSIINICEKRHWKYILNLKKDRLKNVYEEFEDNINYKNETNIKNCYLSKNILFKGNKINALRYVEKKEKKTTIFNYITNFNINDRNIIDIVKLGRRRWKIENEGFNEQKNGTYNISHLCSRFDNALKIHYLLIQIAHTIRQLLELGSIEVKKIKLTKKEISQNIISCLISTTITNLSSIDLNFQLRFDD